MKSKSKPTLFLFNLEVDANSSVLAAGVDWVIAFSDKCKQVYVFSTHVGAFDLPENVTVIELSGLGLLSKFKWFVNNIRALIIYCNTRGEKIVFHHMSHYTAIFPGIFFKIFRAKQGLWYAHAAKGTTLYLAEKISSKTFTSAPGAFPIFSKKLTYLGQGVNTEKFRTVFLNNVDQNREGIFSLGRINPVKNLEKLLESIPVKNRNLIEFMGRSEDELYKSALTKIAKEKKLDLVIKQSMPYDKIPIYLIKWFYYYCGTNIAVDKAVIEAATSGCIVISTNDNVLRLTGMVDIYDELNFSVPKSLFDQINFFDRLGKKEISQIRNRISEISNERNNVFNTTNKIMEVLTSI